MSSKNGVNTKSILHGMEQRLTCAVEGLTKAIPSSVTSLTVGTVVYPVADLAKKVESLLKTWKDVKAAQDVIAVAMQQRPLDEAEGRELLRDLKVALYALLGRQSPKLAEFGFVADLPHERLTPEQLVLRAAKARLTRQARGTKGPREREAIKVSGTPTVVLGPPGSVAPPGAPVVPTTPVAPATPAVPATPIAGPTANPTGGRTAI